MEKYKNDCALLDSKNRQLSSQLQQKLDEYAKKDKEYSKLSLDHSRAIQNVREKDRKITELEKKAPVQPVSNVGATRKPASKSSSTQTSAEKKDPKTDAKLLNKKITEMESSIDRLVKENKRLEQSIEAERTVRSNLMPSDSTQHNTTPADEYLFESQEAQLKIAKQMNSLKQQIYDLEKQVEDWRRVAEVDQKNEIRKLMKKCKQLHDRNVELEELSLKIHHDQLFDPLNTEERVGNRSANLTQVMESRIKDLIGKNAELETQVLEISGAIETLSFDRDAAVDTAKRAEKRVEEITEAWIGFNEQAMQQLEQEHRQQLESGLAPLIPGLVLPISFGKSAKSLTLTRIQKRRLATLSRLLNT